MPESRLQSQYKNGHVGSSFKNTCAGHTFRSRIVHNSNLPHVVSSNWRLDYYKFKKLSCADVLKLAIKNDRVNSSTQCTSLQNTSFNPVIKRNVQKVCTKALPLRTNSPVIKSKGYQTVSDGNMGIQTKNRFQILQGVDNVVQPSHTINTVPVSTGHDMSSLKDASSNYRTCTNKVTTKASKNDAISNSQASLSNNCPSVEETIKYDLPVRIRDKTASYKQLIPNCPTLKLWDSQNKFKFGFIPLGDLALPSYVEPTSSMEELIALHAVITSSRDYNFMNKQINIPSQLNPEVWDHQLRDYWDKQLPLLIKVWLPPRL